MRFISSWTDVILHEVHVSVPQCQYSLFISRGCCFYSLSASEWTEAVLVSHGRAMCYSESVPTGDSFLILLSDEQALITRPLPLS